MSKFTPDTSSEKKRKNFNTDHFFKLRYRAKAPIPVNSDEVRINLRWNRIRKILGHPPRGISKAVFHDLIDLEEKAVVNISNVKVRCPSSMLSKLVKIYSQANPQVRVVWWIKNHRGVYFDKWIRIIASRLRSRRESSFTTEGQPKAFRPQCSARRKESSTLENMKKHIKYFSTKPLGV